MQEFNEGDWVRVRQRVLSVEQRDPGLPRATRQVPLDCYVNGWAVCAGKPGEVAEIETPAERRIRGVVVEVMPRYRHGFGEMVPELGHVGGLLRTLLAGRCSE